MTPQAYLNQYQGQSLLYNTNIPELRGQCVQSVCFYVVANGKPVIWADAYQWWSRGLYPEHYDRIPNSTTAVPQPGDIVIWGPSTPGSGGAGHIAVCLYPRPGTGTFVSVDQNWGGKYVHAVVHDYSNVVGWLRMKGVAAGGMGGGSEGEEMIANEQQAHQAYRMLRPNGDGDAGEIAGTAGKRTWAGFASDAQGEVNARNQALQQQNQHMADMQAVINQQNQTITDLTLKVNDNNASNSDKQKALDDAMSALARQNSEITKLHDKVAELQKNVKQPNGNVPTKAEQQAAVKEVKGIFARLFSRKK